MFPPRRDKACNLHKEPAHLTYHFECYMNMNERLKSNYYTVRTVEGIEYCNVDARFNENQTFKENSTVKVPTE